MTAVLDRPVQLPLLLPWQLIPVGPALPKCYVGEPGFANRLAAFEAWKDTHGAFGCIPYSHGWHVQLALRYPRTPTDRCRPTILVADLRCQCDNRWKDPNHCLCVGDLVYRGVCTGCDWEGPVRGDENSAVEDAHDHAWPGWRDTPIVPRSPGRGTSRQAQDALQRWLSGLPAGYPPGWVESGGPIRTARDGRHVENYTGFGGYDLAAEPD